MPCSDITEVFAAQLDFADHLVSYSLRKRTCGAEIGRADLLADLLVGKSIAAILAIEAPSDDFLVVKHLAATQAALRVYCGAARGTPGEPCVVQHLEASAEGVTFTALVAIDVVTAAIRPCGGCGSCGSKRAKRAV